MPVGKKWMVVVSVMATGVCTALFFRKDASQSASYSQQSQGDYLFRERVERRVAADSVRTSAPALPIPTSRPEPTKVWRIPTAQPASITEAGGRPGEAQPTFQKNLSPVGALLPPVEGIVDEDASDLASERPAATSDDDTDRDTLRHQIRDGDTLTRLAQQYLGSSERYLEIFDLNRDILSTPDLLPIGMMLRIPPREPKRLSPPSGDARPEDPRRDTETPALESSEPVLKIVPIEPPPDDAQ